MRHQTRPLFRRLAVLFVVLLAAHTSTHAADQQQKAKEAEAKRLNGLGRTAEKQDRLLDARQQYLASEHVLYNEDAEKGLEHIAE